MQAIECWCDAGYYSMILKLILNNNLCIICGGYSYFFCTSGESQITPAVLHMSIHQNPASIRVNLGFLHQLGDSPRCSQTFYNRFQGVPGSVIRDPSYSDCRLQCPPRVWFSPEIDASKFRLCLLSHSMGLPVTKIHFADTLLPLEWSRGRQHRHQEAMQQAKQIASIRQWCLLRLLDIPDWVWETTIADNCDIGSHYSMILTMINITMCNRMNNAKGTIERASVLEQKQLNRSITGHNANRESQLQTRPLWRQQQITTRCIPRVLPDQLSCQAWRRGLQWNTWCSTMWSCFRQCSHPLRSPSWSLTSLRLEKSFGASS